MSRPRGRNWQPFATDEEIAALVRAGWSDSRIARLFDANHTSIRYRRRKLGMEAWRALRKIKPSVEIIPQLTDFRGKTA